MEKREKKNLGVEGAGVVWGIGFLADRERAGMWMLPSCLVGGVQSHMRRGNRRWRGRIDSRGKIIKKNKQNTNNRNLNSLSSTQRRCL